MGTGRWCRGGGRGGVDDDDGGIEEGYCGRERGSIFKRL